MIKCEKNLTASLKSSLYIYIYVITICVHGRTGLQKRSLFRVRKRTDNLLYKREDAKNIAYNEKDNYMWERFGIWEVITLWIAHVDKRERRRKCDGMLIFSSHECTRRRRSSLRLTSQELLWRESNIDALKTGPTPGRLAHAVVSYSEELLAWVPSSSLILHSIFIYRIKSVILVKICLTLALSLE